MSNIVHKDLTTTELHAPGYLTASDPGPIGAGKYWIDTTTTGSWILKVRNVANGDWEIVSRMTGIPDSALNTITTPGKVSGAAFTSLASIPAGAGVIPAANLGGGGRLTTNTTVNFTSGLTVAAMQALIDAQPKDLGGYVLTFHFGDGTYTMTDVLTFASFYGGRLDITGNMSENYVVNHITQAVSLSALTSSSLYILMVSECQCAVNIYNIKFVSPNIAGTYEGLCCTRVSGNINVYGCYFLGSSTAYGYGAFFQACPSVVAGYNYLSTQAYGITGSLNTAICSIENASYVPNPSYGLYASGSVIRMNGTQPVGSISNTLYNVGGVIS